MYTSGTAIIFDVGVTYVLGYCGFKCFLEMLGIMNEIDMMRSCLVIMVYIGFFYIINGIRSESKQSDK